MDKNGALYTEQKDLTIIQREWGTDGHEQLKASCVQ
jgi:hypothetical protein